MNKKNKVETLYYTYRHIMFKEAFEILKDQSLAEDAVNESFIRVIRHLDSIEAVACPRTCNFLKIICRNVAKDIYRKRKREDNLLHLLDAEYVSLPTPEDIVLDRESTDKIINIISHMESTYKDVLIMSKIYHIKRDDLALIFGISAEAVTKRLQRAKTEIKKQLAKEGS